MILATLATSALLLGQFSAPVDFEVGAGLFMPYTLDSYALGGEIIRGHDDAVTGIDGGYGLVMDLRLGLAKRLVQIWLQPNLTFLHHRYLAEGNTSQLSQLPGFGYGAAFGVGFAPPLSQPSLELVFGAGLAFQGLSGQNRGLSWVRPHALAELSVLLGSSVSTPHRLSVQLLLGYNGAASLGIDAEATALFLELQGVGSDVSLQAHGFFVALQVVYRFSILRDVT